MLEQDSSTNISPETMTHPVFFSFAGDANKLAVQLKNRFSDDMVYMYLRTGVDGTEFPDEILNELAQCKIFVLFLSKAYIANDAQRPWCRRELLNAVRRVESGSLKNVLIICTDETKLDSKIVDPDTGNIIDALKPLRDVWRAFPCPPDLRSVEHLISNELAQLLDTALPELHRSPLEAQLRSALEIGNFQHKTPIVFVSGFHGSGRKTLIRSVMRSDFKHLTECPLPIDTVDGPEDLLRLIWGEVLQKTVGEQRKLMKDIAEQPLALSRYFNNLGAQLVARKVYIVLSKDEITDVGETIPGWFPEVLGVIKPDVQPLIFCTTPRPLSVSIKHKFVNMAEVTVPTLEDDESTKLVRMTISASDPTRIQRWEKHVGFILESGQNSPQLLVDIIKLASRRPSLDFLDQYVQVDIARFDQRVVRVLDWAWDQIKDKEEILLIFDILGSLGVAHFETLEELFEHTGKEFGQHLYSLIQLGLVEHLSESTYRIPPALRRKLNFYILNPELRKKTQDLLKRYARNIKIGADENGGITLSNSIQIRLSTDADIPPEDLVFVTGAMLFKAGWQRYRRRQHGPALGLFKRAFVQIKQIRDDSTKIEVARYLGLAAAREGVDTDVELACTYLSRGIDFAIRMRDRAHATALFIRGFSCRQNQEFSDACSFFEESLSILPPTPNNAHQRSQILNEFVQCLLKLDNPDYCHAVTLSRQLVGLRETPNNLDVLLRALLAQTYHDPNLSEKEKQLNFSEINTLEDQLRVKCESGNLSFYAFRVVSRLEEEALERVRVGNLPFGGLDLSESIRICSDAYEALQEEALLCKKWDLLLHTEKNRDWAALHSEVTTHLTSGQLNRIGKSIATRIRILTHDFSNPSNAAVARGELDKYRNNKTLPKQIAEELRRKLNDVISNKNVRMLYTSEHET